MSDKYIYIKSYGCQMNVYDSNRIKDLFSNKGYKITKDISKADLTVLNTCHIREKAVEKVYSDIGRVKKIKDKRLRYKAYQERSTEALNSFKKKLDSFLEKDHLLTKIY